MHEDDARDATRRAALTAAAAGAAALLLARAPAAAAEQALCEPEPDGMRTAALAVTPDGRTIWRADSGATTITAFRRRDLAQRRSVDVGGAPVALAIAPDGDHALVVTAGYDRPGLAIVDLRTLDVERLDVGPAPHSVAFAPNGRVAYVTGAGSDGTLTRVRPAKRRAAPPLALGRDAHGVAVAPDGRHALVALNGDAAVAVVDLRRHRVTRRIATPPFPSRVAIAPDGEHALVTHNGLDARTVTPIDVRRGRARTPVTLGADPAAIAYAPSGRSAVVSLMGDGRLAVVDGRTARRRKLMRTGGAPRALAVAAGRAIAADAHTGQLVSRRLGALA